VTVISQRSAGPVSTEIPPSSGFTFDRVLGEAGKRGQVNILSLADKINNFADGDIEIAQGVQYQLGGMLSPLEQGQLARVMDSVRGINPQNVDDVSRFEKDVRSTSAAHNDQIEQLNLTGTAMAAVGSQIGSLGQATTARRVAQDSFVEGQDYCTLAPDSVYGVNISAACYRHDLNYGPDSTMSRSQADWEFAKDIYRILISAGVCPGAASEAAMVYHAGVRGGGYLLYEGQGASR
jgi:hypothetical protein